MKQSFLYSLLFLIFAISSCRKEDNPKLPDLDRVPTPLVLKDKLTDAVISAQEPDEFKAKFSVDLYFKNDVPPQKFAVVIMKNNDTANAKILQDNITTFPVTFDLTGPQLATMFGAPIVLGDKFDIGIDITTKEGKLFQAFPRGGAGVGAGVGSQPGSSPAIRYEAVCKYDPEVYQGAFEVVNDEWEDYKPGDVVTLTKIDDTHFSFEYVPSSGSKPIVITVNATTNDVSVAKQVYGAYSWGAAYGNFSVESVPDLDNKVAPCDQTVSVKLKHTVSAGSFGEYKIVLKKKN